MKVLLVCLLSACLAVTGCTTTRTVPLAQPVGEVAPSIAKGDRVIVTLKSGQIRHLRVETIDASTLTGRVMEGSQRGSSSQLMLTDVSKIQVRKVQVGRTVAWVYGAVLVVGAVLLVNCFKGNKTFCAVED